MNSSIDFGPGEGYIHTVQLALLTIPTHKENEIRDHEA